MTTPEQGPPYPPPQPQQPQQQTPPPWPPPAPPVQAVQAVPPVQATQAPAWAAPTPSGPEAGQHTRPFAVTPPGERPPARPTPPPGPMPSGPMPSGAMPPAAPAARGRAVPLAAGGAIAAAIAGLIGFARWVGTWVLAARDENDPESWIYGAVPTAVQVIAALAGVGLVLAAVLPRDGRRPALVAVLAFAVLVAGFTVNDAMYQVVTSIYYR